MANGHQDEHAQGEHTAASESGHAHAHDPLESSHLIGHVKDTDYFELPRFLGGKVAIPQLLKTAEPIATIHIGFKPIDDRIEPLDLKLTKFMVLEVVAAVILIVLFSRLAGRLKNGDAPKGRLTNLLESMIVFIRDEVARPAIGHHDADRFLPFLLTIFFFIVGCNLLGLVPFAGSATGALGTTAALALLTFATVIVSGMAKLGPVGFWVGQVPHMDLPLSLAIFLKPMIFGIEHDGRAFGADRDPGVHCRQLFEFCLVGRHAGQCIGCGGAQLARTIRGVLAGLHLHVFVGPVYWHGRASALADEMRSG